MFFRSLSPSLSIISFTDNSFSPTTCTSLMTLGLSGGKDSGNKRAALLKRLDLPAHMSCNAMLQALNLLYSLQELTAIMEEI